MTGSINQSHLAPNWASSLSGSSWVLFLNTFSIFLIFNYKYVGGRLCVAPCTWLLVSVKPRGTGCPRTGITCWMWSFNMGPGNPTKVFCKPLSLLLNPLLFIYNLEMLHFLSTLYHIFPSLPPLHLPPELPMTPPSQCYALLLESIVYLFCVPLSPTSSSAGSRDPFMLDSLTGLILCYFYGNQLTCIQVCKPVQRNQQTDPSTGKGVYWGTKCRAVSHE